MKTSSLTHVRHVMAAWRETKSEVTYEVELHDAHALIQLLDRHGFTVRVSKMAVEWGSPVTSAPTVAEDAPRCVYPDVRSIGGRVTLAANRMALSAREYVSRRVRKIDEVLSDADLLTVLTLSVGLSIAQKKEAARSQN